MRGFFKIKQGIQRIFGTLFISLFLFGLFVPRFLRGFPLTCYNLIGQRCVIPMDWSNLESLFVFSLYFPVFVLLQFSFLWWEDSSSFSCTSFFYQYIHLSFPIKKKSGFMSHVKHANSVQACLPHYMKLKEGKGKKGPILVQRKPRVIFIQFKLKIQPGFSLGVFLSLIQ